MTKEYRERMYGLIELYQRPYNPEEPVICVDEKNKQVVADARKPLPMRPGKCRKEDATYERKGVANIFMALDAKSGKRYTQVTERRTKMDFVSFVLFLLTIYSGVKKLHLVLDNLNTHFARVFEEILGKEKAASVLAQIEFHHTPIHASWLNMAEIEIGVMERQCTGRRFEGIPSMTEQVAHWQTDRNTVSKPIQWSFSREKADRKLSKHYLN